MYKTSDGNKFGVMAKQIATFLQLLNRKKYTGHCLMRSSPTLVADAEAAMTTLIKHHGGWKSACTAEWYIANSKKNKIETARMILNQINNDNCTDPNDPSSFISNHHDSKIINRNSNNNQ